MDGFSGVGNGVEYIRRKDGGRVGWPCDSHIAYNTFDCSSRIGRCEFLAQVCELGLQSEIHNISHRRFPAFCCLLAFPHPRLDRPQSLSLRQFWVFRNRLIHYHLPR